MIKIEIIKKIFLKIRYRLLLFTIKKKLSAFGVEISTYSIFQLTQPENTKPPKIKDKYPAAYEVAILGTDDIKSMGSIYSSTSLHDFFKKGDLCIGIKHNQKIISVQFFNFTECDFSPYKFKLKSNEAYVFGLNTIESYRGKNIAPYSTYHSFNILKNFKKNIVYTVNDCLNSSSLKVTKKNNARPVLMLLHINLFKKFQRSIVLKKYGWQVKQ